MRKLLIVALLAIFCVSLWAGGKPVAEMYSLTDYSSLLCYYAVPLNDQERRDLGEWGMRMVEKFPRVQFRELAYFLNNLLVPLSDDDRRGLIDRCKKIVESDPEFLIGDLPYLMTCLNLAEIYDAEDYESLIRWMMNLYEQRPNCDYGALDGVISMAGDEKLDASFAEEIARWFLSDKMFKALEYEWWSFDNLLRLFVLLPDDVVDELAFLAYEQTMKYPSFNTAYFLAEVFEYAQLPMSSDDRIKIASLVKNWFGTGVYDDGSSGFDCRIVTTNVVVNYVLNSIQPEFAIPATSDTGFVNIITEVKGGAVAVPASWADNYPAFTTKFGTDFTKALAMKTGKKDGAGNDMLVWQDYIAGTDPTKEDNVFKASITIVDGKVTISYSPELDDERKALRKYTTWGKRSLLDTDWTVVQEGQEAEYNFFKVSVEMK